MSAILTASDLVVRYNQRAILDAATLGIEEGDRIGLVGRNGCGKTTFLKILAGLQSPDGGEVTARRDLVVSYLSQDFTLDASLDVRGNVRQGARHVLNLIAEFESLPAESKRHEELEHRIQALEGWSLDQRIETAMSHLNCVVPSQAHLDFEIRSMEHETLETRAVALGKRWRSVQFPFFPAWRIHLRNRHQSFFRNS